MNPATTKIPKNSKSFKIMCQLVSDNNEEGQTLFDDWTPNINPLHSWGRCLCGVKIYHQFTARNEQNGRELFPIGAVCIKRFHNKEASKIVDKALRDYHKKKKLAQQQKQTAPQPEEPPAPMEQKPIIRCAVDGCNTRVENDGDFCQYCHSKMHWCHKETVMIRSVVWTMADLIKEKQVDRLVSMLNNMNKYKLENNQFRRINALRRAWLVDQLNHIKKA
jgi:hypothetical protein